ncbi:hypothetical protein [Algoriphagus yeomjeoni]|uniref:Uncharacterized protein n=1 Tax=Algoriphagus yeomjeoni TaxID=291403 RepID=A0A327PTS2_9BACT|nr:hypothetical protein [Algoriphagus yeomjeoni]RAI94847.1 hypothetical protein LV83_00094 [Algoriphagus yeomjeoni]
MGKTLKLNEFLYQRSAIYLIAFFAFALLAFWSSYFSVLGREMSFYMHFHGIFMTLWVLLLIVQALLIRIKKYVIHRLLGKVSYVTFPILILSTFLLIHATIRKSDVVDLGTYFSTALMINGTIVLVIIYSLGIIYRKDRLTHARYMVCTIFPLFTPITDRIIYKYIPSLIEYAPTMEGMPVVPFYGYAMADVLVIALAIWDWRVHKRKGVFLIVLVLLLCYHISLFTFYKLEFWKAFSAWFYGLSLT